MNVRIRTKGMPDVQRLARRIMTRWLVRETAGVLQRRRMQFIMWLRWVATWVSPAGYFSPVDRGGFIRAWHPRNIPRGVVLHNDKGIYSQVLEVGRRPGAKRPPIKPIQDWLTRKGLPYSAFQLAKRIGRRGQRPRLVATNAMEGLGDMAERAISREIDRILARI